MRMNRIITGLLYFIDIGSAGCVPCGLAYRFYGIMDLGGMRIGGAVAGRSDFAEGLEGLAWRTAGARSCGAVWRDAAVEYA